MQKTLRSLAVILFLVASFAVASTPTPKSAIVFHEGSSPVPLCMPGMDCGPGGNTVAAAPVAKK